MQYLFFEQAGEENLNLEGDEHRYIFKVRRHREGEVITLRNLRDDKLYFYRINTLSKKEAMLSLERSEVRIVGVGRKLHIIWCVIDPKSIEKVLPTLNELGVDTITFLYCTRSQKSFKIDFKRLEKILLNSSQQCGRSLLMTLNFSESLEEVLEQYPETVMLNFSENKVTSHLEERSVLVGCEGGFTSEEMSMFRAEKILGLDTPLVLKSESAACAIASKLIL